MVYSILINDDVKELKKHVAVFFQFLVIVLINYDKNYLMFVICLRQICRLSSEYIARLG